MLLQNISFKIQDKFILKNINTEFKKGINLIIGPNGSGKSTLLKIIYQINEQTTGEIKDNQKKNISYLGQYNSIFHNVEVEYFLKLNRYLKTNKIIIDQYTERIIDIFSIRHLLKQALSSLSGGERQKVMIASVFLLEKPVVLLDEPLSFLDISAKLEIVKILENEFKNLKLIIVTHNFNIFKNINKVIALKEGHIFYDGENKPDFRLLEKLFDIEGSDYFSYLPLAPG